MTFERLNRFHGFQLQIVCQIPLWAQGYKVEPDEIERQILLAHGWAENNPKRAPKSAVMRYLNGWMSLADRKGSMRRVERRLKPREPEPEPDMSYEDMVAIRKRNMGEAAGLGKRTA